jgi:hypothetical protein
VLHPEPARQPFRHGDPRRAPKRSRAKGKTISGHDPHASRPKQAHRDQLALVRRPWRTTRPRTSSSSTSPASPRSPTTW